MVRAAAAFKDDPSSPRHEALARQVAWTDELIAFATDVIGEMATWPVVDDWGGWLARLQGLVPRVLVRPDRVLATLKELQPLAGVSDVRLDEVRDVLRDRLTHLSVPPPPHRYGSVFVGTPDQVRGRAFDVVCVLGLSERVFPQRSRQDPLLLDRERSGPVARSRHRRRPCHGRTPPVAARDRCRDTGPRGVVCLDGDGAGTAARAVVLRHRRATRSHRTRARLRGTHP